MGGSPWEGVKGRCECAVSGQSPWAGSTDPAPWPQFCPSGWVTWLLRASISQPACGLMVARTDLSFAQNRAERGLVEIPQNTIRMGLTALFPAVMSAGPREQRRADLQQSLVLQAEHRLGVVVGGVTAPVPRPCQHEPFRLQLGEPKGCGSNCAHQGGLEDLATTVALT